MMSDSSAIGEDKEVAKRAEEFRQDNPVLNESGTETDPNDKDENEGPTSSVENIIPLNKLKNGWFALSAFVATQACTARDKAIELNNSEAVQNMKKRTADTVGSTWDKSIEVATPYWEKTKEVTVPYVEKTKENAAILTENMRPHVEAGWKSVSEAAVSAAEYTTGIVQKVSFKSTSENGAFDSNGSNMTV